MVRALSVVVVLAVIALSAAAQPPPVPRNPLTKPAAPAVALTALAQPLMPISTAAAPIQPLDLVGQQINFHINLLVDFVATGAQLVGRQLAIPRTLIQDVQNGVPLVDAASRALVEFVNIELDAGRELVGFAVSYVDFQLRFVVNLLRDIVEFATSIFVGPALVTPRPAPPSREAAITEPTVDPRTSGQTASTHDDVVQSTPDSKVTASTATEHPKRPKPTPITDDSVAVTTLRAQGQVRSAATEPSESEATATATATGDGTAHPGKADVPKHDQPHADNGDTHNPAPSKKADAVR